jgi:hypothetical protein
MWKILCYREVLQITSLAAVLHNIVHEGHHSFIKTAHCELQSSWEKCDKLRIILLLQVHLVKETAVILLHAI